MPTSRRSRRRPWTDEHVPLDLDRATGGRRTESAPDGEWTVQRTRGSDKTYVCPGCRQDVAPRTAHVVAWANDSMFGADSALADRRHWHAACWDARARRR